MFSLYSPQGCGICNAKINRCHNVLPKLVGRFEQTKPAHLAPFVVDHEKVWAATGGHTTQIVQGVLDPRRWSLFLQKRIVRCQIFVRLIVQCDRFVEIALGQRQR
uniref:Uncharacterized protein n=1 Tax=Anopheles christyi TaxID=43041 RepID=A0A182KIW5_9DIPT